MKRSCWYAAMTKDEVQSAAADRMTFYEAVINDGFMKRDFSWSLINIVLN
jgi:hypothetical protein